MKPVTRTAKGALMMTVLCAAVAAQAGVAYLLPASNYRAGIVLMLVAPVLWGASGLGVIERLVQSMTNRPYRRQYLRLRSLLDRLIAEVRRMNGLALDQRRGVRDPEATRREMDRLEAHLIDMIKEMRVAAGEVSERAESITGPVGSPNPGKEAMQPS